MRCGERVRLSRAGVRIGGRCCAASVILSLENPDGDADNGCVMPASPTKVLVVDDELHVAASVTLALGREYRVDSICSGREAFEMLRENARGFDIVIADHMMPGWAGSELIQRLQAAGFRGKCILLSGHLSPQVEAIYRGLGVEYIIPKPFDLVELRNAVKASARAAEDGRN